MLSTELGRLEIKTVDAQESLGGGVTVLVAGYFTGNNYAKKDFVQSFFLAPQENGFYVLNDVFRVVEEEESNHQEQQNLPNGAYAPLVVDHGLSFFFLTSCPLSFSELHFMFFFLHFYADLPSEDVARDQTVPLPVEDKVNGGEVSDPSENGEVEEVTKPIVDVHVDDAKDSQPLLVNSDVEIMQANVVEEAAQPNSVDSNVEIAQVVAATEVAKDSQQEAGDAKRSYASIVSYYTLVDFYKVHGLFGMLSFANCKNWDHLVFLHMH